MNKVKLGTLMKRKRRMFLKEIEAPILILLCSAAFQKDQNADAIMFISG